MCWQNTGRVTRVATQTIGRWSAKLTLWIGWVNGADRRANPLMSLHRMEPNFGADAETQGCSTLRLAQHGGAHTEREVLSSGREAWHRRTPRRPLFAPSGPLSRKKASAPLASAVLPFIVTKRAPRAFIVERTDYGWSVKAGAERLGLFVTQRQALTDVGRRRAELKASGQTTTLVVVSGSEPVLESRPFRAW